MNVYVIAFTYIFLILNPVHHRGDGLAQGCGVTRGGVGGGLGGHRLQAYLDSLALPAQSIVYLLPMNAALSALRHRFAPPC